MHAAPLQRPLAKVAPQQANARAAPVRDPGHAGVSTTPLFLQRCGSGCGCGAASGGIRVSRPDDPAEREAERVARAVVTGTATSAHPAMGAPRIGRHLSNGGDPGDRPAPAATLPDAAGGAPLPADLRAFFEPRIGADFGDVRVHTGAQADASARAFAARAYTLGRDVVFGAGEYQPQRAAGRELIAHELVHVAQQRRGMVGRACVQRQPSSQMCTVQLPEDCATFELWLLSFRSLPTFTSEDGIPIAEGGHPQRFTVLGDAPASRDPNAPAPDRPVDPRGPRTADRFIDHPTDAWVRRNLPENLRLTAYQLPADCADILVILRHVYLSAHHRTERYGGWLVGDAQGRAAQRRIGGVIAAAATINLERVVNPYIDAQGRPIRDFARLEPLLHPGDQLVWDHHDDGLARPRTGGHSQTIMEINRGGGGRIQSIDVLQGNQPLFERQAREIIADLNADRAAAGHRPLPRSQTAAGGPLEMSLRHSPGRRIEVSTLEHDELQDVELPRRRGSSAPATRVWTWGDAGNTILEVAGPPRSAARPRMRGRGSARTARLSDWLGSIRAASATTLHGVFEGALHETRAVIDGGGAVPAAAATDLATTAGNRLWSLARRAVDRLVAFGRRRGDLGRGDLGDRAHFEPLHRIRAMIRALGGIEPAAYHGNPTAAANVRATFRVIDREFDFAARGGDDIAFGSARRGGELVRILITGFDPFDPGVSGPPAAGEWNPSGAAALSLDGTRLGLGGRDVAAIQAVVLPVSFAQFGTGIVERAVQRAGPDVDAVLSVSLDPNLATTDPVRIEQFAVGVHRASDIQPHRLLATETVANPGLRAIRPGGAPIVESNIDVTAVAAETLGRERRGLPSVLHPTIGRDITLRFATPADAVQAAAALGAGTPTGTNLVLGDEAIVRAVMTSARPVSSSPGANAEITFLAGSTRVRATLVRGPGGSFLSNEVFYRVRTEIARTGSDAVSFHVHTPGAAPIPQATGTRAERSARRGALQTARDAVVTLVATLRRMAASVGRRVVAARRAASGP
jgi:pyrrolidone-carboxylate peptidase